MYIVLFVIGCVECVLYFFVIECVDSHQFLSYIFLLRCFLKYSYCCKCTDLRRIGFKFYFCVQERKVHEHKPVTVYSECEFSSITLGVASVLFLLIVVIFLLLLFSLSWSLVFSFLLAYHLLL
jgi:hypothetical protein